MLKVNRQFERRGPLYVPNYDVERPWPARPLDRDRGDRLERYRRRFRASVTYSVYNGSTYFGSTANITISSTSAGDTIFVWTGPFSGSHQSFAVSDNASGGSQTYSTITALGVVSASGLTGSQGFYKYNSAAGVTQVSVSNGGNGVDFVAYVYKISGLLSSSDPLDISLGNNNANGGATSSGPASPSSGTLAQEAEFVIGCVGGSNGSNYGVSQIASVGGSWTLDKYSQQSGGGAYNHAVASLITSATSAVQATFTANNPIYYWNGLVSFKAASSGTQYNQSFSSSMAPFS